MSSGGVNETNDRIRPARCYSLARCGLVTTDDIIEYDLDSVPVDANGRTSVLERFIHGEIYKARTDVAAVIHSHSPAVLPFSVAQLPMQPV